MEERYFSLRNACSLHPNSQHSRKLQCSQDVHFCISSSKHVPKHLNLEQVSLPSINGESWLAVEVIASLPSSSTNQAQPEPKRPAAAF